MQGGRRDEAGLLYRKEMCIVQWKEQGQKRKSRGREREGRNREGAEEESGKFFEQKDEKKELRI
jgi:hypothetical protein